MTSSHDFVDAMPFICSQQNVKSAILSFPCGSAAGPDLLRPQHLKDMLASPGGDTQLLPVLTAFMNLVVRGDVPSAVRPLFFGANLLAFNKKEGGLRPIAVGNTLRRLSSKLASGAVMPQAAELLMPMQLGCGVPGGAEAIVHAARNYVHKRNDFTLVKLDFANAFNSVKRQALFDAVDLKFPAISSYVRAAYHQPSHLRFGDYYISSEKGVQQGDPLGPLLFCLAIHPLLEELCCEFKVAYLDDITIAGRPYDILHDIAKVEAATESLGLMLNVSKCEILTNSQKNLDNLQAVHPNMKVVNLDRATLLGAALTPGGVSHILATKIECLETLKRRIYALEAHDALFLLRHSLAVPRVLYTLRTSPCTGDPLLMRYDGLLRHCATGVLNVGLSDTQWLQASLPPSFGGLGFRSVAMLAPSAFLASAAAASALVTRLLPANVTSQPCEFVDAAAGEWRQLAGQGACTPVGPMSSFQRAWDRPVVKAALLGIRRALPAAADQARLLAVCSRGASAWLNALPLSSMALRLNNEEVRVAAGLLRRSLRASMG